MATNYVWSDFGVLTSTPVDVVNDSTHFQEQSTVAFTVSPGNPTTNNVGNLSFSGSGLLNSTRPGWLLGRRPQTGQLFPRGVRNR